jgi:hypothetical protein
VSYSGLIEAGTAGCGLTAATSINDPLAVNGSYSCCDAEGGSVIIELDGEQTGMAMAYFGTNVFRWRNYDRDMATN